MRVSSLVAGVATAVAVADASPTPPQRWAQSLVFYSRFGLTPLRSLAMTARGAIFLEEMRLSA